MAEQVKVALIGRGGMAKTQETRQFGPNCLAGLSLDLRRAK